MPFPRLLTPWLLAIALLAVACGKKAAPLPPGIKAPPPVEGFRATVRGYEVRLSWRADPLRRGEERPTDVTRYQLYREDVLEREASDCDCRRWEPLDTVDLEYPANAFIEDGRVEYILPLAGYERSRVYAFTVAAENRYGVASALAEGRILNVGPPPPPVEGVKASVGETWVDLSWPAVRGASAYRLYRSAPGEELQDTPYATVEAPRFSDRQVVLDQPYVYVVTALGEGRYPAESRPSAAVTATPRDITPPAAPAGLIAVAVGPEVRLSWEPGGAVDLATYRVWRSVGSSTPDAVARVAAQRASYTDTPPAPGTYRYHLTAVDRHGNESPPSHEVAAIVAVEP
ncbi:MAG: hypothetical protein PVF51_09700 [Nitrospirota bacterium]